MLKLHYLLQLPIMIVNHWQFILVPIIHTLLPVDSLKLINNCSGQFLIISPVYGQYGEANITVTVKKGGETVSTTFKVIVINSKYDFTILGSNITCLNDTLIYNTVNEKYVTIKWRVVHGNIIGPNNDSTVTILWNQTGIGNLVLTKQNIFGQQDSLSEPITINDIPPKPSITKIVDTLISNAKQGNQWYLNGNPIPGATSKIFYASQNGKYTVQVTLNGCPSPFSDTLDFVYIGDFDLSILGSDEVCQNDTIDYSTSKETNVTESWRVDNGNIIGSINDTTLKVLWDTTGIGDVVLIKENASLGKKDSSSITIIINDLPPKPKISKFFNTLISNTAQGNQWYKDGEPIAGATKSTYNATENGNYTVRVTQNGCPSPLSDTFNFIWSLFNLTITGSQSACQNDTLIYTTPKETNVTISWTVNNGIIIGPADSSVLSVNWCNLGSGNVVLQKANISTGKKDSDSISIIINEVPPQPTITKKWNTMTSSAAQGNQWYRNGKIIPGATENTYTTLVNAKYSVIVTLNGCSSPPSIEINFIAGVEDKENSEQITIIPNPANDKLIINTNNGNLLGTIEIYSLLGIRLFYGDFDDNKAEIDISTFPVGIYLVKIGNFRKLIIKN